MSQTVAVTGATSYIGVHLVDALLRKGYTVHALTRDPSNESKVGPLKALLIEQRSLEEPVQKAPRKEQDGERMKIMAADVNDQSALEEAFRGCTGVMHLAVPHPMHGTKPVISDEERDTMMKTAKLSARACFAAASKVGVKKVVYTSSFAACELGNDGALDETSWSAEEVFGDVAHRNTTTYQYIATKTVSEKEAWVAAGSYGIPVTVICPGNLVCGDILTNHINATVRHIENICLGNMTMWHIADTAPVNVKDVCRTHIAALEQDSANGKRYICASQMIGTPDLVRMIKEIYPKALDPTDVLTRPSDKPCLIGRWNETRTVSTKLSELGISIEEPLRETIKTCVEALVAKKYIATTSGGD